MKRTFVVPEEKEVYYEKFKELVPEVSGQLVALIEEYVNRHEALQAGMSEQTVHKGVTHGHDNIFLGTTARFTGMVLAEGSQPPPNEDEHVYATVYLTKKNKFLFSWDLTDGPEGTVTSDYRVYDNYNDIKGRLTKELVEQCEEYLSKNSTIRTYEILDV